MAMEIDLTQIERRMWQSFLKDGLLDIVMGLFLLTPGIRILTDNVWFTAGFFIAVPIMIIGRCLTRSRLGHVKFGLARQNKLFKGHLAFSAVLLAVLAVWVVMLGGVIHSTQIVKATLLGVGILVIYASLARYMDLRRFYLYGILLGTGMSLLEMDYEPAGPIAFIIAGSFLLIWGIVAYIRFLVKYPRISLEDMDFDG